MGALAVILKHARAQLSSRTGRPAGANRQQRKTFQVRKVQNRKAESSVPNAGASARLIFSIAHFFNQ